MTKLAQQITLASARLRVGPNATILLDASGRALAHVADGMGDDREFIAERIADLWNLLTTTAGRIKVAPPALRRDPNNMNNHRADFAAAAITAYDRAAGNPARTGEDQQTILANLLGDLMHYCDQAGLDFRRALRTGATHYWAEKTIGQP